MRYLVSSVPDHTIMMDYRAQDIVRSIYVLDHGGPPLLMASDDHFQSWSRDLVPGAVPIATGDDQGYFFYLPLMGHVLHISNPYLLNKWFAIALFVPLLMLYPIAFAEAFDSVVAGIAAPILLLSQFGFVLDTELYFALAWAILMGLPALILIHRRWGRWAVVGLFLVTILAAFANTIRFQAGLPVLLAAVLVVMFKVPSWPRKGVLLFAMVVVFALTNEIPAVAARYRDAVAGTPYSEIYAADGRTLWHSAYIALGYMPNDYGIRFDDAVARDAVERVKPGLRYQSREYDEVLRGIFLDLARRDPGLILGNVINKSLVILNDAVRQFGLALIILPLGLHFGPRRRAVRTYIVLGLPAIAVTYAANVLYMPSSPYNVGWLSAWGYLWLLAVAWLLPPRELLAAASTWVPGVIHLGRTRDGRRGLMRRLTSSWRLPAAVVGVIMIATASAAMGSRADSIAAMNYYRDSAMPLIAPGTSVPKIFWDFSDHLGAGWSSFPGVAVSPARNAVEVTTNTKKLEYQLWSDITYLPAGRYVAIAAGTVVEGGLYIGALDTGRGVWLGTSYYWSGQQGFDSKRMAVKFETTSMTPLRIVLSNWAPKESSSFWILRDVTIVEDSQ